MVDPHDRRAAGTDELDRPQDGSITTERNDEVETVGEVDAVTDLNTVEVGGLGVLTRRPHHVAISDESGGELAGL